MVVPDEVTELVHELVQGPTGLLTPVVLDAKHEPVTGGLEGLHAVNDRETLFLAGLVNTVPASSARAAKPAPA